MTLIVAAAPVLLPLRLVDLRLRSYKYWRMTCLTWSSERGTALGFFGFNEPLQLVAGALYAGLDEGVRAFLRHWGSVLRQRGSRGWSRSEARWSTRGPRDTSGGGIFGAVA